MWLLIADESVSLTGYVDCILVWVISTLAKLTFHYSKKNKKTEKKNQMKGGNVRQVKNMYKFVPIANDNSFGDKTIMTIL